MVRHITRLALILLTCAAIVLIGSTLLHQGATQASPRAATELYIPFVVVPQDPTLPTVTPTPGIVTIDFFNANTTDIAGPGSHANNYGKKPEIIVAADGTAMTVLAQNYGDSAYGIMLQIEPDGSGGYDVTQMLTRLPMLERVMGLAIDGTGNRYYATGVDEESEIDANPAVPAPGVFRSNIVRVVKIDASGNVLFNTDLDTARAAFDANAGPIINPMKAGSARLAIGGNELALVFSIFTAQDSNGVRHQGSNSTRLNASTGAVTRHRSIWVSHSFDQRLLYDGSGIAELHRGDAFPRSVVLGGRDDEEIYERYHMFHIKGGLGWNHTFTEIGNAALIESDPTYRYLVLFVSENSANTATRHPDWNSLAGQRNLAIVRASGSDYSVDPALPDTLTVDSKGTVQQNKLRWLTSYSASSNLHASRAKLIAIGGNEYIVLWEQWEIDGPTATFQGVYGMRIDATGSTLAPATLLTTGHHLHRGDDAFRLGSTAAWMTADTSGADRLYLHTVDAALTYTMTTIDVPAP